jgi:hypothetical protein
MSSLANFDFIFLFFVLGLLSSWIKSDLRFSYETSTFLAVFLLLSLGLKGGHEVRAIDGLGGFFVVLLIGLASCLALPTILFFMIRGKFGVANSAALAASYGSVSAVTFVTAQKKLREAWSFKTAAIVLAIFSPLLFGSLTLVLALWLGIPNADRVLLAVLVGSASYIAAPAAIRSSIPEANPSLYLALPLALTFPMNLLFGIQYYIWLSGSI